MWSTGLAWAKFQTPPKRILKDNPCTTHETMGLGCFPARTRTSVSLFSSLSGRSLISPLQIKTNLEKTQLFPGLCFFPRQLTQPELTSSFSVRLDSFFTTRRKWFCQSHWQNSTFSTKIACAVKDLENNVPPVPPMRKVRTYFLHPVSTRKYSQCPRHTHCLQSPLCNFIPLQITFILILLIIFFFFWRTVPRLSYIRCKVDDGAAIPTHNTRPSKTSVPAPVLSGVSSMSQRASEMPVFRNTLFQNMWRTQQRTKCAQMGNKPSRARKTAQCAVAAEFPGLKQQVYNTASLNSMRWLWIAHCAASVKSTAYADLFKTVMTMWQPAKASKLEPTTQVNRFPSLLLLKCQCFQSSVVVAAPGCFMS